MLNRIKYDIKKLESKKKIMLDDVLEVFEDLCADVRDQEDVIVTQLRVEDRDQVLKLLRSHGRIILNIASAHPELFEAKFSNRFNEICEKLEVQEIRFEEKNNKKNSIIDEIKEDEKIVEQLRQKIELLENEVENIQEKLRKNYIKLMKQEEEE